MEAIDPTSYRWFWVNGELKDAAGYNLKITISAHADDLVDRADAADVIAERVRKHYADAYQMPGAEWTHIEVTETHPSQAFIGDPLNLAGDEHER